MPQDQFAHTAVVTNAVELERRMHWDRREGDFSRIFFGFRKERAAWLAPGVRAVDNKLEIQTEVYAL